MMTFYGPSFETKVAAGLGRTRRSRAPYSGYPEYGTEGVKIAHRRVLPARNFIWRPSTLRTPWLVAAVSRPFDAQMVEKHRESADFLHFPRLGAIPQQAS